MAVNYTYTSPVPGVTPGTQWAQDLNDFADNVKAHNHTGTDEVKIVPASMNINTNVNFQNNGADFLKYTSYTPGGASPLYSTYVDAAGDLYYQNGAVTIRLTGPSGIYIPGTETANGFYGDYSAALAQVNYQASTSLYGFYGAGGFGLADVNARSFAAETPPDPTTQRSFQTGTSMGLDGGGFYIQSAFEVNQFAANAWLAFRDFDTTSPYQKMLHVGAGLGDTQSTEYKFMVTSYTTAAFSTNQPHTKFTWLNNSGSGPYSAGSGFALDFAIEASAGSGVDEVVAQLRPFWNGVDSNQSGGVSLYAKGFSSRPDSVFQLQAGLGAQAAIAKLYQTNFTSPYTNSNPTLFSAFEIVPSTNGINLGNSTNTRRWNAFLTSANLTGSLTVTGTSTLTGDITSSGTATATTFKPTATGASSPAKATLYTQNIPLAWGRVDNTGALLSGFNITSTTGVPGTGTSVVIDADAATTNSYSVAVTCNDGGARFATATITGAGTFTVTTYNATIGPGSTVSAVNTGFSFVVMGT